jgi:hypothetical protein
MDDLSLEEAQELMIELALHTHVPRAGAEGRCAAQSDLRHLGSPPTVQASGGIPIARFAPEVLTSVSDQC